MSDETFHGWTHAEFVEDKMRRLSCHQIAHECRLGLVAAENLDAALLPISPVQVWLSIRGVLACAANVAKLFWPNPRDKKREQALRARGEHLRHLLGIDESSVLFQKEVRDGFEHIEERLDRWFEKGGNYGDLIVGPLEQFGLAAPGASVLRHFDPATGMVRVLDETANLNKIVQVLRDLYPKAASRS